MPSGGKEVVTPMNKVLHETIYKIPCIIPVHFVPQRVSHSVTRARTVTSTVKGKEGVLPQTKSAGFCHMKGLH